MSITNPTQLIDEFKKSGEFDRLRRELLAEFQKGEAFGAFDNRVKDIAKNRLDADPRLRNMMTEAIHRELMQELDRYPLVERTVSDTRILSDSGFSDSIRRNLEKMLKGGKPEVIPISTFTKGASVESAEGPSNSTDEKMEQDPSASTRANTDTGPMDSPSPCSSVSEASPIDSKSPSLHIVVPEQARSGSTRREDSEKQQQAHTDGEGNLHGEVKVSSSSSSDYPVTHTDGNDRRDHDGDHGGELELPPPPIRDDDSDVPTNDIAHEKQGETTVNRESSQGGHDVDMKDVTQITSDRS